jgi:predicted regulator of Ras-like GTPase activity (Roadblock/LC7/MglB family)
MDPHEALADLKQISVQIAHAVVADQAGMVLGSTLADPDSSRRLARTGQELWDAADGARRDLGRDELAQLEVATPDGSVFLVRDAARLIVATTSPDPTVGLVFYDLKACLRSIAEGDAPDAQTATRETPAPEAQASTEEGHGEA